MLRRISIAVFLSLCVLGSDAGSILARKHCNDDKTVNCENVQKYCRDLSYETLMREYCPKTCRFCTELLGRKSLTVVYIHRRRRGADNENSILDNIYSIN